MPDNTPVTQADRDAAADFHHVNGFGPMQSRRMTADEMRNGRHDRDPLVKAFAAHRISHSLPGDVGMRWRPILRFGDMPLDGTWFAARCTAPGYSAVRIVHYADRRDRLPIDHSGWVWPSVPTEWVPLDEFAAALEGKDHPHA